MPHLQQCNTDFIIWMASFQLQHSFKLYIYIYFSIYGLRPKVQLYIHAFTNISVQCKENVTSTETIINIFT